MVSQGLVVLLNYGLRIGAHASWRVGCDGLPWHGNPADCGALHGLT